jgi:hypothetical protein
MVTSSGFRVEYYATYKYKNLVCEKRESEQPLRKIILLGGVALLIAGTYLIYQFGGLLWLMAWLGLVVFALIEVLYYYGSKGSLFRSFRSHISSDAPDTSIEMTTRTPRGWYDLDYRGRGRN